MIHSRLKTVLFAALLLALPCTLAAQKKKAATKKAETPTNVATKTSIKSQKKSIDEVKPEDMKVVKSESTSTKSLNPNSKPNPADVFKKN